MNHLIGNTMKITRDDLIKGLVKVGDKVRCINDTNDNQSIILNRIYTVKEIRFGNIRNGETYFLFEEQTNTKIEWWVSRFELVREDIVGTLEELMNLVGGFPFKAQSIDTDWWNRYYGYIGYLTFTSAIIGNQKNTFYFTEKAKMNANREIVVDKQERNSEFNKSYKQKWVLITTQKELEMAEIRRTYLMGMVDEQRKNDNLPPVKWEELPEIEKQKLYNGFQGGQQDSKQGESQGKGNGQGKVERSKSNEEVVEPSDQEIEVLAKEVMSKDRLQVDQLIEIQRQVTDVVLKELDQKTKDIIKATLPTKVIVSFKVNGKEIKEKIDSPHPILEDIINLMKAGSNVLLVGPAGCGKTMLAEQCAKVLDLTFGHLCFSAGVSEVWLYGRQTPKGFTEGEFSKMYREGGVFLGDELDAADANLLLSINTALANGVMYNPISGERILKHKDFHFLGAANTFGKGQSSAYSGRNRLDAATLDRFVAILMDYIPSIEDMICPVQDVINNVRELRAIIKKANSPEVISYRAFDKAYKMHCLGYTIKEIRKMLTVSWNEEMKKLIG